jgi:DNA mismatch repair protein MutS2
MLSTYPAQAPERLEFDKIRQLLLQFCRSDAAKQRVEDLRLHTRLEYVQMALEQTQEYVNTLGGSHPFPADFTRNIERELKYLSIPGAILKGEELIALRTLALTVKDILHWFKNHDQLYPRLRAIAEKIEYEKDIAAL